MLYIMIKIHFQGQGYDLYFVRISLLNVPKVKVIFNMIICQGLFVKDINKQGLT